VRRRLVVGNWKMNGGLDANRVLLGEINADLPGGGVEIAVCVPYPYLAQVQTRLRDTAVAWGAQNVSQYASGPYTGEVSAAMLSEFGCRYVIVGHSERRHGMGEDSATVAAKCQAVLSHAMTPIVCVGESLDEREGGVTQDVVLGQLDAVIAVAGSRMAETVVAYEPVWAIGTGRTATPQQAQEVHALLRGRLQEAKAADVPLLYGGSVKSENAAALFAMADIDGGLIGGASLNAKDYLAICRACG
jgi:triosephosphate isomerase (TIM)